MCEAYSKSLLQSFSCDGSTAQAYLVTYARCSPEDYEEALQPEQVLEPEVRSDNGEQVSDQEEGRNGDDKSDFQEEGHIIPLSVELELEAEIEKESDSEVEFHVDDIKS